MFENAIFAVRIQKVVIFLQEAILQGKIQLGDPFKLIEHIYTISRTIGVIDMSDHKQIAIKAIERIAAGADGISGTDDDLIPVDIVQKITALINSGMVGSLIDYVASHEAQAQAIVSDIAPTCMKPIFMSVIGFVKDFINARKAAKTVAPL